jgi:UDP-N-acetylmuramate dehydrogenase
MQIHEKFPLKPYNTFSIDAKAKFFNSFSLVEELEETLMMYSEYPIFILGGGSNILFTKDYDGAVLKNEIR